MKIYTKTGDSGTTGLFAGPRVAKDHPRIEAYGTVDELNALLGVVNATLTPESTKAPTAEQVQMHSSIDQVIQWIADIQSDLFSIGAQLATPDPDAQGMCLLDAQRITELENWVDQAESDLQPLQNFILPGGSLSSATLHLARTVCRRAERDVVALSHQPGVYSCELLIIYLNRLSDLLFVLARHSNARAGVPDQPWSKPV